MVMENVISPAVAAEENTVAAEENTPAADDALETVSDLDATDERGVSADLVRAYLNGIGRTKLLTAVQEVELAKRIEPASTPRSCSPPRTATS